MGQAVHRELTVPNDTAHLAEIRKAVLEVLGEGLFPPDDARLLALAVDEAVANVMEHAYRDPTHSKKQDIQVVLDADKDRFQVLIRDSGRRFDPCMVPSVDITDHVRKGQRGGLGIFLMRKIMDEVNYSFKNGAHNELQMIKYVDIRS